jgi:hypothetical protein
MIRKKITPIILAASAAAAEGQTPAKDARHQLMLASTRAEANFRVADALDWRLRDQGLMLHAQLIAMRLRIQATLNDARAAFEEGDFAGFNESLTRADALIERFAKRIGGY